jgi:hypothetical protein
MYWCCCPKCYAYVGVFEKIGDFPYRWAMVGECSPEFLIFLFSSCTVFFFCCICRRNLWSKFLGKLLLLAIVCIMPHSFCFFSGLSVRDCILEMWNLRAAILCSTGWLEWKFRLDRHVSHPAGKKLLSAIYYCIFCSSYNYRFYRLERF